MFSDNNAKLFCFTSSAATPFLFKFLEKMYSHDPTELLFFTTFLEVILPFFKCSSEIDELGGQDLASFWKRKEVLRVYYF